MSPTPVDTETKQRTTAKVYVGVAIGAVAIGVLGLLYAFSG